MVTAGLVLFVVGLGVEVLPEGREHLGLDLGPEIEKALAKDTRECVEAAATPARSGNSRCKLSSQHTWKPPDSVFRNQMFVA